MKAWCARLVLITMVVAGAPLLVAEEGGNDEKVDAIAIIDGIGTEHELTVSADECVRIRTEGIAGATFAKPVIKGPARIIATYTVRTVSKDGKPLVGAHLREYIVKPTGKGAVTVTTKVTSPIPGQEPQTKSFKFKVE